LRAFWEKRVTAAAISLELIQFDCEVGVNYISSQENYNKLQDILRKGYFTLNFIRSDISNFDEVLDGKFDVIMLSNIYDYVDHYNFCRHAKDLYNSRLNPGGVMQVDYSFSYRYFPEELIEYFKGYKLDKPAVPMGAYILHKPRENAIEQCDASME